MPDNSHKIILDLCGGTGAWSRPYVEAGYDVRLVTLPEQDVRLYIPPDNVYGILAAPPCTMFSFARTRPKRPRDLNEGMETVIACLNIIWHCQKQLHSQFQQKPVLKFWCLENPRGMLQWFLGRPVFEFDPCEFGAPHTKKTHLWGCFNYPERLWTQGIIKRHTKSISDIVGSQRPDLRAITPPGFAKAFFEANQ